AADDGELAAAKFVDEKQREQLGFIADFGDGDGERRGEKCFHEYSPGVNPSESKQYPLRSRPGRLTRFYRRTRMLAIVRVVQNRIPRWRHLDGNSEECARNERGKLHEQ